MSTQQPQQFIIPEEKQADRGFKVRRILLLIIYITAAVGLLSFDPADMDFLASGLTGLAYPHNRIGAVGAYFSWGLLLSIGLAAYPLMFLLLLCSIRRLIWRGGLQRVDMAYFSSIPLFALGISFLLGLNPSYVREMASVLNLNGFPGGVIGQQFCAPGSGWLYILLSTTGVAILALTMIAVSVGVLWYYDWREVSMRAIGYLTELWERWRNERDAQERAETEYAETAPAEAASATVPEAPVVNNTAVTSEATERSDTYRTRRGEASLAAARAAEEAINGTGSRRTNVAPPPPPQRPAPASRFTPTAEQGTPRQQSLPEFAPQQNTAAPKSAPTPVPVSTADDDFTIKVPAEYTESDEYLLPQPASIFAPPQADAALTSHEEIENNRRIIQDVFDQFEFDAEVCNVIPGPQITLFEISLGPGVMVNKLNSLATNLTMNLMLSEGQKVRIIPNIPGKRCAGIEVPNTHRQIVTANELFTSKEWQCTKKQLPLMLGKNITGERVIMDLADAPHLLVAGATGMGKSVCINLMIQSMLLRFTPEDLRMILVDPKFMEFNIYKHIPHLLTPVINDPQKVGLVLRWAVNEMNRRCQILAMVNCKNLFEFNHRRRNPNETPVDMEGNPFPEKLPFIVIIIDELADIMICAKKEVEPAIQMLAQKARAAGIHLLLSTQRPDKDVVTGLIKANLPIRIALGVKDVTNSRIILDEPGAESLMDKGDMLYKGKSTTQRLQCGFVTNSEIEMVCRICAAQAMQVFDGDVEAALQARDNEEEMTKGGGKYGSGASNADSDGGNDLISQALQTMLRNPKKAPTISFFQMALRIGYGRSKRLVEELEEAGYIGPLLDERAGKREIYWSNFPGYGGSSSEEETLPEEPADISDSPTAPEHEEDTEE